MSSISSVYNSNFDLDVVLSDDEDAIPYEERLRVAEAEVKKALSPLLDLPKLFKLRIDVYGEYGEHQNGHQFDSALNLRDRAICLLFSGDVSQAGALDSELDENNRLLNKNSLIARIDTQIAHLRSISGPCMAEARPYIQQFPSLRVWFVHAGLENPRTYAMRGGGVRRTPPSLLSLASN